MSFKFYRLGGKNHEVKETSYTNFSAATDDINAESSGVMFVGADVTHPSPDARDIPSVVGVAASHDQVGFRYNCAWRLQSPKEEMIQDLENILFDQLDLYKQKNGKLPAKLMYYRDGVSDGQFGQVLEVELAAIRRALKRHYGKDQEKHAKVTFIVVQKRHHTRFFPTDRNSGDGSKNNNIPAGTVNLKLHEIYEIISFLLCFRSLTETLFIRSNISSSWLRTLRSRESPSRQNIAFSSTNRTSSLTTCKRLLMVRFSS